MTELQLSSLLSRGVGTKSEDTAAETGLLAAFFLYYQQKQRGATITLRNPSNIIRRVIAATGLTDVLQLEP